MRARKASACAPAYSGWSVPKCVPMSPRPAAESSASTIACATASPSEWPDSAGSPGHSRPASQSGPSPPKRVHVGADADARIGRRVRRGARVDGGERMLRHERPRTLEVGGRRDLERERDRPRRPRTACPAAATSAASSVYSSVGGRVGGIEDVAAEALRRLRGRRARSGRPPPTTRGAVDALDRVDDRQHGDRHRAAPASTAATTRSNTSGGVSARAASCTSTISTSPHSASSPAATDAWRVAPPVTTETRSRRSPAAASASVSASPSRPAGATTTTCAYGAGEDAARGHDAASCARRCRRTPSARPRPGACPSRPRRR